MPAFALLLNTFAEVLRFELDKCSLRLLLNYDYRHIFFLPSVPTRVLEEEKCHRVPDPDSGGGGREGVEQQSFRFCPEILLYRQSRVSESIVVVEKPTSSAPLLGSFSPHIFP
jgi:hypothetical protein